MFMFTVQSHLMKGEFSASCIVDERANVDMGYS